MKVGRTFPTVFGPLSEIKTMKTSGERNEPFYPLMKYDVFICSF